MPSFKQLFYFFTSLIGLIIDWGRHLAFFSIIYSLPLISRTNELYLPMLKFFLCASDYFLYDISISQVHIIEMMDHLLLWESL